MDLTSGDGVEHAPNQLSQPFIPKPDQRGEVPVQNPTDGVEHTLDQLPDQRGEGPVQSQAVNFSISRKPVNSSSTVKDSNYKEVSSVQGRFAKYCRHTFGQGRFEFLQTWWLELISCALFSGALIAVILTLWPYEGQSLPQWPYGLTVNSLVSVYIVILKAAMLLVAAEGLSQLKWTWFDRDQPLKDLLHYDDASRGPWGCLKLLWRLRGRQLVSSCGAFIAIAALIIDPFAQQVIATYGCRLPTEDVVATIPRTNAFDEKGVLTNAGLEGVSLEMQNYIRAGIFNPGQYVDFSCETGECTFSKSYKTVGFCSECNDTTNEIDVNEALAEGPSDWTLTYLPDHSPKSFSKRINMTGVISPDDVSPDLIMSSRTDGGTTVLVGRIRLNQSQYCADTCPSLDESNLEKCRENWKDIKWGCAGLPGLTTGIGAASCSLFPCVKTYSAQVDRGRLHETLLSTSRVWGTNSTIKSTIDVDCLDSNARNSLRVAGHDLRGKSWIPLDLFRTTGEIITINSTFNSLTNSTVPAECIYQHDDMSIYKVQTFLSYFLDGITYRLSINTPGPPQLLTLYNDANISFERLNETWHNISESITTYMRQNGVVERSAGAPGQAFRAQTCIHIRWGFLAYPAILVILAITFFIGMIIQTRRRETSRHDWKSSSLALLYHGLDSEALQPLARDDSMGMVSAKAMEKLAESTPVRLSRGGEEGWLFRKSGTKSEA